MEVLNVDLSAASLPTVKTTKNRRNKSTFFPSQTIEEGSIQANSRNNSRQLSIDTATPHVPKKQHTRIGDSTVNHRGTTFKKSLLLNMR